MNLIIFEVTDEDVKRVLLEMGYTEEVFNHRIKQISQNVADRIRDMLDDDFKSCMDIAANEEMESWREEPNEIYRD